MKEHLFWWNNSNICHCAKKSPNYWYWNWREPVSFKNFLTPNSLQVFIIWILKFCKSLFLAGYHYLHWICSSLAFPSSTFKIRNSRSKKQSNQNSPSIHFVPTIFNNILTFLNLPIQRYLKPKLYRFIVACCTLT